MTVVLDTNLNDALIEEGFVNEMVSKLQTMRKDAGFEVMDHIRVTYQGNEKLDAIIAKNAPAMAKVVLAEEIKEAAPAGFVKDWNINGESISFGVEKL